MNNNKRNPAKKRRRGSVFGVYRRSVIMIVGILLLFMSMVGIKSMLLKEKNREYERQETELKTRIREQKDRADKMQDFKEYVKSSEYEKEIARERLGLVDPNEIIFKASD